MGEKGRTNGREIRLKLEFFRRGGNEKRIGKFLVRWSTGDKPFGEKVRNEKEGRKDYPFTKAKRGVMSKAEE